MEFAKNRKQTMVLEEQLGLALAKSMSIPDRMVDSVFIFAGE